MILVDSSVWIAHLRGQTTPATTKLELAAEREPLLVGDLILLEVLQGAKDEAQATRIARALREYAVVSLLDDRLAVQGARNYRHLRSQGIPVRRTVDVIIGTFCIEHGHSLLHEDRAFEPMETHLGLKTA